MKIIVLIIKGIIMYATIIVAALMLGGGFESLIEAGHTFMAFMAGICLLAGGFFCKKNISMEELKTLTFNIIKDEEMD